MEEVSHSIVIQTQNINKRPSSIVKQFRKINKKEVEVMVD
jgi:hypothetical protein